MNFDEQSVRAHRHCPTAEGDHEIRAAATLARVDNDWQMRFFLGDGDRRQIQGIAGVGLEGSDSAFAEQDIRISVRKDVFCSEQPFFDAFAHSPLEQDRLAAARCLDEKLKVLTVPRSDLQNVGDLGDMLDVALAEHFGDDLESGLLPSEGEEAQAFLPETLKFIRRGARLVGASAEDGGPGLLYGGRRGKKLLFAFDRAGSGHQAELVARQFPARRH